MTFAWCGLLFRMTDSTAGLELHPVGSSASTDTGKPRQSCTSLSRAFVAAAVRAAGSAYGSGVSVVVLLVWCASYPSLLVVPHLVVASRTVLTPAWSPPQWSGPSARGRAVPRASLVPF